MEETLLVTSRKEWGRWLEANAETSKGIWLIYFKKHTGKPTVSYEDAVREALCHGWIDSTVRRIDEERYMQRFAPRRKNSGWSPTNRRRAEALLAEGKIHQSGLARIDEARANGNWDKALEEKAKPAAPETPEELLSALAGSEAAREFFDQLSPSRRQQMVGWVGVARKPETRHRRAAEAVALLSRKKWLGMK